MWLLSLLSCARAFFGPMADVQATFKAVRILNFVNVCTSAASKYLFKNKNCTNIARFHGPKLFLPLWSAVCHVYVKCYGQRSLFILLHRTCLLAHFFVMTLKWIKRFLYLADINKLPVNIAVTERRKKGIHV